jgi:hypothetical protein
MAEPRIRILILGGYGTFGGRLAELLSDETRLTLIIAGRSLSKAEAFRARRAWRSEVDCAAFDREGELENQLQALRPDIIVDASGPFQEYDNPYRLVRAAIAHGIHYLDLADATDFVAGIARLDDQAKDRGVFVLSGVSSFPVLTAAVVRHLSHDMARIESITGGVAPSPYAGVGLNVIRAISSYAGKPVELPSGRAFAFVDTRWFTIAPPGAVPLRPLRFSLVNVPDLKVLPELWPTLRIVWMGVAPVPASLHRALNTLAWLVRWRVLPSLLPFASLMHAAINILRWGEHRGGMFVEVKGVASDGAARGRSWHLVAEGDDGPFIPSMAAAAIIARCLDGQLPPAGARSAVHDLDLADYERFFAARAIRIGTRERPSRAAPLYRRILGEAWDALPAPLRTMHELTGSLSASGLATVERGSSLAARLIAGIFRFPNLGANIPVTVSFHVDDSREVWHRDFADRGFTSTQEEGRGRFERLLCERFGPFSFGLALVMDGTRMSLVLRSWSLFGIPLPLALAPRGAAYEHVEEGRFCFHVEIAHRWAGLIVRYRGWLMPIEHK